MKKSQFQYHKKILVFEKVNNPKKMSQSWEMFLDENEGETATAFLPSSLHEVWGEPNKEEPPSSNFLPNLSNHLFDQNDLHNSGSNNSSNFSPKAVSFNSSEFYFVQFHPNRSSIVRNVNHLNLEESEYVVIDADRGIDVGKIIRCENRPQEKDLAFVRNIIRKATNQEILLLQQKEEKEKSYVNICQEKANELSLQMKIVATELQFDGKKLTVYFTADKYIDFRDLVHSLFRIFGTRIWMVWFDGSAPIKDVFTHHQGGGSAYGDIGGGMKRRRMTMD
ncbi:hypothetical protein TRFO_23926 [Tritrichomonas foetus]|uniref:PSP1 C-terminal domain-containing protein n=1 Tax=Tritrichomonas foetus TaxID=1144522 RepID=A0A1J4KDP5_9EUKA|nr:hypothetical protein TRFO_23926 [Tritrichomonas foetus]|eukprot:OHT07750.1 hypothetical protein TRFO_23926 [Tritrichomonas foetus]